MISEANIPNLMRCVANNEKAPGFNLHQWDCGTYGCLFGNDMIANGLAGVFSVTFNPHTLAESEYGLSQGAELFLFSCMDVGYLDRWVRFPGGGGLRSKHDREAALSRLRKFIYYVLHKRELLYDDRGCIRETARRAEGNHMVLSQVKEAVRQRTREPAAT